MRVFQALIKLGWTKTSALEIITKLVNCATYDTSEKLKEMLKEQNLSTEYEIDILFLASNQKLNAN